MSTDSQLRSGGIARAVLADLDAVVSDPPPPMAKNLIAEVILIDQERHEIVIDGIVFPWATAKPGPDVEPFDDGGRISQVTLRVLADNVVIHRPINEDLDWIRDIAAEHKRKALAQFEGEVMKRRMDERQDFNRRMAAIKRDPQVQKLRRIADLVGGS